MIRDGSPTRGPFWSSHVGEMLQPVSVSDSRSVSASLNHHHHHHNHYHSQSSYHQHGTPETFDEEICDVEYVYGRQGHGTLFAVNAHLEELPTNPAFIPSTSSGSGFDLTPISLRISGSQVTVSAATASFALFSGDFVADGLFLDEDSAAKNMTGFPTALTLSTASAPSRRITLTATPDQRSQEMIWALKRRFESQRTKVLRYHAEKEDEREAAALAAAAAAAEEEQEQQDGDGEDSFQPSRNRSSGGGGGGRTSSPSGTKYRVAAAGGGGGGFDDPLLDRMRRSSPPGAAAASDPQDVPITSWNALDHRRAAGQQSRSGTVSSSVNKNKTAEPRVMHLSQYNSKTQNDSERRKRSLNLAFAALDDVIQRSTLTEEGSEVDRNDSAGEESRGRSMVSHRSSSHHAHDVYGTGDPVAAAIARRSAKEIRAVPTDFHPLFSVPVPSSSNPAVDSTRSASKRQQQVIGPAHPLSQLLEGDGMAPSHPIRAGQPVPVEHLAPPSLLARATSTAAATTEQTRRMEAMEEVMQRNERQVAAMKAEMDRMREQVAVAAAGGGHGNFPRGTEARHIAEAAIRKKSDGSIALDFDSILTPPASRSGISGREISERKADITDGLTAPGGAGAGGAAGLGGRRRSFSSNEMLAQRERATSKSSEAGGGSGTNLKQTTPPSSAFSGREPAFPASASKVAPPTSAPDPNKPIPSQQPAAAKPAEAANPFASSANPIAAAAAAAAEKRGHQAAAAAAAATEKKPEPAKPLQEAHVGTPPAPATTTAPKPVEPPKTVQTAPPATVAPAKQPEPAPQPAPRPQPAEPAQQAVAQPAPAAATVTPAAAAAGAPGEQIPHSNWTPPAEPTPAQQAAEKNGWPLPPAGIRPPPKWVTPPPPPGSPPPSAA